MRYFFVFCFVLSISLINGQSRVLQLDSLFGRLRNDGRFNGNVLNIILQNIDRGDMPVNFVRRILYNQSVHYNEINIPDSVLSSYVGEYQISPKSTITISREGHQLSGFVKEYGQLKMFFLKSLDADLEFVKDKMVMS